MRLNEAYLANSRWLKNGFPTQKAEHKKYDEHDNEYKKQKACDTPGCRGNSREPE
jgi:hypothetical protein